MGILQQAFALTCLRHAWRGKGQAGIIGLLGGVVLAIALLYAQAWITAELQPVDVHVTSVQVQPTPITSGYHYAMVLRIHAPTSTRCERVNMQSLQADRPGEQEFFSLGSAMNGGAWENERYTPMGGTPSSAGYMDFALRLNVGAGVPPGNYYLIYKTLYDCSVFGIRSRVFNVAKFPVVLPARGA